MTHRFRSLDPLRLAAGIATLTLLVLAAGGAPAHARQGLTIENVVPDGPCARAGLRGGDEIVSLGGLAVDGEDALDRALERLGAGDLVTVVYRRGGERHETELTLGPVSPQSGRPTLGVMIVSHGPRRESLPDRALDTAEVAALVDRIATELETGYVDETRGKEIAAGLRDALAGAPGVAVRDLVPRLNELLLELSNDRHLSIGTPDRGEPVVVRRRDGPPDEPGPGPGGATAPRVVRRVGPGDDDEIGVAGPGGGRMVRAVDRLDGNVGLLDLAGFPGPEAKEELDRAMLELAGVDALIVDLRRNGGGQPWSLRYLSGFFFAEPTHLTSTRTRGVPRPEERWTLDGQPTRAFVSTPIYVLTSRGTFSAAESFLFGLKRLGRVTAVGERTGGGGHFTDTRPLPHGLVLRLPIGRTYDPDSGRGWETEGIAPDVEVPAPEALEAALGLARSRDSDPG